MSLKYTIFLFLFFFFETATTMIDQKGAIDLYEQCQKNKDYRDIKNTIDGYLDWIEKKEYEESDQWLLDRLNRLTIHHRRFSYKRPKDDEELEFILKAQDCSREVSLIRIQNSSLCRETILLLNYPSGVYKNFFYSFSPNFKSIAILNPFNKNIDVYNRKSKETMLPQVHAITLAMDESPVMIAITNDGKNIAYITGELVFGGRKHEINGFTYAPFRYTKLHIQRNGEKEERIILLKHPGPFNKSISIFSMSFNESGTKVGVKTNIYSMIVDLADSSSEPRYYPYESN